MEYTVITVVKVSVRILSVKSLIPAFAVEVIEVFIIGIQWVCIAVIFGYNWRRCGVTDAKPCLKGLNILSFNLLSDLT